MGVSKWYMVSEIIRPLSLKKYNYKYNISMGRATENIRQ